MHRDRESEALLALRRAQEAAVSELLRLSRLRSIRTTEKHASPIDQWSELNRVIRMLDAELEAAHRASEVALAVLRAAEEDPSYWVEGPDKPKRFEPWDLHETLQYLPSRSGAAFALACAERLAPAYRKYCEVTGHGDADGAARVLLRAWEHLAGSGSAGADLAALASWIWTALELPHDDDPWRPYAADAVAASIHAVRALSSGDPFEALYAAECAHAAAVRHAADRLGVVAGEVWRDPVVQAELMRQARDLYEVDEDDLLQLRDLARAEGPMFFGPGWELT